MLHVLETMLRIRSFELKINDLFAKSKVRGTAHLCVGQEAIPAGACSVLHRDDPVVATHRGHGAALAKGLDEYRLFAEILGRRDGYCAGRGGSQHIACIELGFLGTNGITGGGLPVATGAALAIKKRNQDRVVVAFFGDGASNQGTFHESLNMAAIWQLPIVYVCENNLYAMSAPASAFVAGGDIARRADAYGIRHATIDGNDVIAVRLQMSEFVKAAREGNGPALVECRTYRHLGHSKSDKCVYRTREEEQAWLVRDPIRRFRQRLLQDGDVTEPKLDELEQRVQAEIDRAAERALACLPVTEETLQDHVHAATAV